MKSGELRHKITIKEPIYTKISSGEKVVTYKYYAERHAKMKVISGVETEESKQLTAQNTIEWTIRYCAGIKPDFMIEYRGTEYAIKSINNLEGRNIEQIIRTVELVK